MEILDKIICRRIIEGTNTAFMRQVLGRTPCLKPDLAEKIRIQAEVNATYINYEDRVLMANPISRVSIVRLALNEEELVEVTTVKKSQFPSADTNGETF